MKSRLGKIRVAREGVEQTFARSLLSAMRTVVHTDMHSSPSLQLPQRCCCLSPSRSQPGQQQLATQLLRARAHEHADQLWLAADPLQLSVPSCTQTCPMKHAKAT